MLNFTLGYDVQSIDDPVIAQSERVGANLSLMLSPGNFWVDAFPWGVSNHNILHIATSSLPHCSPISAAVVDGPKGSQRSSHIPKRLGQPVCFV